MSGFLERIKGVFHRKEEDEKAMYIIAGLGNPTKEYEKTRHNVGFEVIDVLADRLFTSVDEKKFKGYYGKAVIGGEKVILLKPQTFMNLSGESVRAAADFYKVDPDHIIVVYDDVSLDVGQLRIRTKGSAGGIMGLRTLSPIWEPRSFRASRWAWEISRPGWTWRTMCWVGFPKRSAG